MSTIVVKVGTSTLTDREGNLDREYLPLLANELCDLLDAGHRVVFVTSGAVRAGGELLGWTARPKSMALKQAAAAIGQGRLMALYASAFESRGRVVAQVLLTRQLADDRPRYVNAQNTLHALLRHDVVPIINENDTVSTEEIRFGDNDTLAALVSALVSADLLILLTNVEGLLDQDKRLIPRVPEITPELKQLAGGASGHGSGGMATKLLAAEIAGAAGVPTVIARGRRPGVLRDVVSGAEIGTRFDPPSRRLRGRKHWLAYGTQPRGSVTVNECAWRALVEEHKSLLPAGVVAVQGPFAAGETVSLCTEDGEEFARGLASWDWRSAEKVKGLHTGRLTELLGEAVGDELIHRDNLVIL